MSEAYGVELRCRVFEAHERGGGFVACNACVIHAASSVSLKSSKLGTL